VHPFLSYAELFFTLTPQHILETHDISISAIYLLSSIYVFYNAFIMYSLDSLFNLCY